MVDEKSNSKFKLENPIDYRILILILGLSIGFQILLFSDLSDNEEFTIDDGFYLAGILGCGIAGTIVSKKYWGSEVFGKAYLFLGIGFFSWFIGDTMYFYYDYVLKIDTWPTPADVFFVGFYVLATLHLYLNSRYFRKDWNAPMKISIIVIPIVIVATYTIVAFFEWGDYEELPFDLFYGAIFAAGSAIVLAFAVVGVSVFRQSILGKVWLLLAIGIFLSTLADVWYVYLEIFEVFTSQHPANTIWVASFMIIIYALYKHQKTI